MVADYEYEVSISIAEIVKLIDKKVKFHFEIRSMKVDGGRIRVKIKESD